MFTINFAVAWFQVFITSYDYYSTAVLSNQLSSYTSVAFPGKRSCHRALEPSVDSCGQAPSVPLNLWACVHAVYRSSLHRPRQPPVNGWSNTWLQHKSAGRSGQDRYCAHATFECPGIDWQTFQLIGRFFKAHDCARFVSGSVIMPSTRPPLLN